MGKVDEATKRQRMEAVWSLVRRSPGGILEREIADTLNLPRRTVNNYLRELELEGRVYKEGRLWRPLPWEETRLRPVDLTPEEAIALYLGARLLSKQMDRRNEPAESALLKLANALRNDAGLGEGIVQAARILARRPEDTRRRSLFREVVRGYIYRRKVRLLYKPLNWRRPFETTFATYLLEPSLIGSAIYLIGHSSRPNALRAYKLERIQEIALTAEPYDIPSDFAGLDALRHAWNIMLGEETVEVVLRFSPRVRERVQETIWHPSQTLEEDPEREGWLRWRAHIAHLQDILPWIRSWGADVEALAPPELARALREEARRLMHLYFPDPRPRPPHLHLWAKAHRDGSAYHPLLYHLLDVAACAEGLWEHAFTSEARAQLARDLNLSEEEARRAFVFLAAAHDIGKASPAFQTKVAALREALRALDYDFPEAAENGMPHGVVSAWVLRTWLQENLGWHKRAAHRLARVAGAHHGIWPTSEQITALDAQRLADVGRKPPWAESRSALLDALAQVFHPPQGLRLPSDLAAQNRVLALLAGLITVADWLGSMEDFFPYEDRVFAAGEYLPIARQQAQQALKATGWLHAWRAQGEPLPFEQAFPFSPNAIQAEGIRLAQDARHPALLIVEAPTGQGKTELALYLADAWLQERRGRGLYIAMPTQATSNAMYTRLRGFLQRRYPEQHLPLVLAHSRADDVLPRLRGMGEGDDDAVSATLWFLPRKRALLASFGVGTVDQALMGALQARHHYLRLFGLAHKVVIFDEVHAYDTYMEHLFLRLLTWLRAVGTSVIVLSATLPRATREKMIRAWGAQGLPMPEVPYPRLTLVTPRMKGGAESVAAPVGVEVDTHALPAPSERIVALGWLDATAPEDLATWLDEQLEGGGCAVVICNTVNRAQEVYEAVRRRFPAGEHLLFHARMPFAWREKKEKQVMALFGKEAEKRPHRFVLVATQVVEQSLDLDFDLMVSELAPIDLLIQRAGRLHRHRCEHRPTSLETPQLWVLHPGGMLADLEFGANGHIYAPYILWRTYLALHGRRALHLPKDTDRLIQAVYTNWQEGGDALLQDFDGVLRRSLENGLQRAWEHLQRDRMTAASQAGIRMIVDVSQDTITDASQQALDDDEEALKHPDLKALTRLIAPNVTLLPLHLQPDGRLTLEPNGGLEVNLQERPSRAESREIRRFLVQVQHRGLVWSPNLPTLPLAWQRVAGLRGVRPVLFEQGQAQVGPWRLTLDEAFGLRIRKEEA
ncbi:MAG TPA: CRISPR-associated helicase Cas3' [Anaerolineae bacterium]|nr:CRISPR-associated helicase Cas3' [Anaerolineae bacterium]HIQ09062.1 CRISPR-associated helicase Cas3' [Anaerolineaceae bacterium]